MHKINGYLLNVNWNSTNRIAPIRILEINENSLYPVKYSFKAKGYKNFIFSARLSEVEILN